MQIRICGLAEVCTLSVLVVWVFYYTHLLSGFYLMHCKWFSSLNTHWLTCWFFFFFFGKRQQIWRQILLPIMEKHTHSGDKARFWWPAMTNTHLSLGHVYNYRRVCHHGICKWRCVLWDLGADSIALLQLWWVPLRFWI